MGGAASGRALPVVEDSPFPPIADYGFLSDCHTGALVASDGAVEWLCLPHFDSPSVFAAMLDRGAGRFRVGPYGVYVPAGRRYLPGTNVIETTWMTPQGWLRVIDALTIGEWHENEEGSSHTRPPTDYDADHLLVRVIECIQGQVQVEMVCEPMLDYGATTAALGGGRGRARARWTRVDGRTAFRLFSDMRMGIEGNRVHGAPHDARRREALLRDLLDGGPWWPAHGRAGRESPGAHAPLLADVAGGRDLPRPPLAPAPAALGAGAEGPDVHAHRSARRRADDLAAGDAAGRAQLGLPLLLDARRDVHAVGAARARAGLGGR